MTETNSIGTPLTSTSTKVLLLGAGELGRETAIAFHYLGLEAVSYTHLRAHET